MELRESLMQTEIQHLNKKLFLLSAEIIFVQDFIREEFGSKFEAFCNARREQQRIFKDNTARSSSTKRGQMNRRSGSRSFEEDGPEVFGFPGNSIGIPEELDSSSSSDDEGFPPMADEGLSYEDAEEFEIKPDVRDLERTVIEPGKKGRRKSIIHRYYQKVATEDGHMKHKCFTCGAFVSGQAQRLRKHLIKCRSKSSKRVDEALEKIIRVEQAKESAVIDETSLNDINKKGRRFDRVRLVFKKVKDPSGFTKMKCLNCGHLASNQPGRMRKHLEKCREVGHRSPAPSENSKEIPSLLVHPDNYISSYPIYPPPIQSLTEGGNTISTDCSTANGSQNYIVPSSSTPPPIQGQSTSIPDSQSLHQQQHPPPHQQSQQPSTFTGIQNSESDWPTVSSANKF